MSDLHGEYKKYIAMLEKISFSDDDILFILGDVVDRGENCTDILKDMMLRSNVYPILGNHEVMAKSILGKLLVKITDDNYASHIDEATMRGMLEWQQNGGNATIKQFSALSEEERFDLLSYLDEFEPYQTVDTADNSFILVHSGLGNFSPDKRISEYSLKELCFMRPDYDKQLFSDNSVFIVSGHTPTQLVSGKPQIYKSHNNINIDCGAVFGGRLACIRLDDFEEFYV